MTNKEFGKMEFSLDDSYFDEILRHKENELLRAEISEAVDTTIMDIITKENYGIKEE